MQEGGVMTDISSFSVAYDRRADVLYIAEVNRSASRGVEDRFGIVWRYDEDGRLIGATVMDFIESWSDDPSALAEKIAERFKMPVAHAGVIVKRALELRSIH